MEEFLNKFIIAQKQEIDIVKKELKNQKKETHWIWYMFPQLKGLGKSQMSNYYGLNGVKQAKCYYENTYLRNNLIEMVDIILNYNFNDLNRVFGEIDNKKVCSCMTLFYLATKERKFKQVIDKFYYGCLDNKTMLLLNMR